MTEYLNLWETATAPTAAQDDINALGEFMQVSSAFSGCWNGEYWSIGSTHQDTDDSIKLYPVYTETEPDEYEVTGYRIV